MANTRFPKPTEALDGRAAFASVPWYDWFLSLNELIETGQISDEAVLAAIRELAFALGSPDGTIGNIPPQGGLPKTTYVQAGVGIAVAGTLATGGVVVSLATLADSGVGDALWKFTRDQFGRVEGTSAATTDDLGEGLNNLYFTDERAQDAVGSILDGSGDVQLFYADGTPLIFGLLSPAIHALLALAGSAVQSIVAGTNITVDATDPQNPVVSATGGGGAVSSVFGRTGAVVAASGDYTVAQVTGALPATGDQAFTTPAATAARLNFMNTATGTTLGVNGLLVGIAADGSGQVLHRGNFPINIGNNALAWLSVQNDGRVYGRALHNNAGSVSGTVDQHIASGTYTPTLTAASNVASLTPLVWQWMRVGNVVTVSGLLRSTATAAANTITQALASLPIASNLAALGDAGGAGAIRNFPTAVSIFSDTGGDRFQFQWLSPTTSSTDTHFSATYLIL